jgi:O-antigen ligase
LKNFWIKYFYAFSFLISFPIILILGTNASLLFLAITFISIQNKSVFIEIKHPIQFVALLLMIGAIISVIDTNSEAGNGIQRGLVVLPNYIYWCILLIFFINIKNEINLEKLSQVIFKGLTFSILFYLTSELVPRIPGFLNFFSPNNFAFLCICFSAPASVYILYKKGYLYAIIFTIIVSSVLLFEGRRAGFILVLMSCFISINIKKFNLKNLIYLLSLAILSYLLLNLKPIENLFATISPRIHELIYQNDDIASEDRSYLTRKLMFEKSLIIFSEHPLSGIGLNNFSDYEVGFLGDFDGADFVMNKEGMNETSAHNSYAGFIAEGGLFLFIPFITILLFNIINFITNFSSRSQLQNAYYWSFLAMTIHLYFISAILNVYAWFLIGLVSSISCLRETSSIKSLIIRK